MLIRSVCPPPTPFPVAFLFNWIGFCLSFCLTNTIAGRYGAICGFGLSLIKWILIVRVRSETLDPRIQKRLPGYLAREVCRYL